MDQPHNSALDALRKAVIQQKSAALPEEEQDALFQSLHQAMVEYDQYVSEAVIQVLMQNGKASPYPRRTYVQTALEAAETAAEPRQQRKVEQYRKYLDRLDDMINLAVQVSVENP